MVAFGLILVLLSGLLGAGVLLTNTDPVVASAFGVSLSNVTLGELFLIGAGTGVVLALGLIVAAIGARRRRAKRRGLKDQVEAERSERELLEEQNALLREQLQRGGGRRAEGSPAEGDVPLTEHAEPPTPGDVGSTAGAEAAGAASPAWTYPATDAGDDPEDNSVAGGPADHRLPQTNDRSTETFPR